MDLKKEQIKKLAKNLMFELQEHEIEAITSEFQYLESLVSQFEEIETEDVSAMVYPFEEKTTYLRDDEIVSELDVEDVFKNAPNQKDGYFVVPKVVD